MLENIHIQKRDTLARAPLGPPKMYQYILDQKWDVPLRPQMYQYILCQKVRPSKMYQYTLVARALSRPPKMYQYILDQKWDVPLKTPKMYQYILDPK